MSAYKKNVERIRQMVDEGLYVFETCSVEENEFGFYDDNRYIAANSTKTDEFVHYIYDIHGVFDGNDILHDILNAIVNSYNPKESRLVGNEKVKVYIWDRRDIYYLKAAIIDDELYVVLHHQGFETEQ